MKVDLNNVDFEELTRDLEQNGFLALENILTLEEVQKYAKLYEDFINGKIEASKHRHDLGSHVDKKTKMENITQIMWPSLYMETPIGIIKNGLLFERAGRCRARTLHDT